MWVGHEVECGGLCIKVQISSLCQCARNQIIRSTLGKVIDWGINSARITAQLKRLPSIFRRGYRRHDPCRSRRPTTLFQFFLLGPESVQGGSKHSLPSFFPRKFWERRTGASAKGVIRSRRLGIVEIAIGQSVSPSSQ